jgi:hypothetical protein
LVHLSGFLGHTRRLHNATRRPFAADWPDHDLAEPMTSALRLIVSGVIIVLLARSARVAWSNRDMAVTVWRRIRARHVAGSLLLLVVVFSTAVALMTFIPVTSLGLGSVLGLTGNAVFAPVEEAAVRSGAATGAAPASVDLAVRYGTVAFMVALLVMFPWLAYVEEEIFRRGLETASWARRGWAALRFGLVHMVMLVPLGAALAIGVAGLWYGRVYVRAFQRAAGDGLLAPEQARSRAVLESTVWHTSFNSLLVVLLIIGVASGALVV